MKINSSCVCSDDYRPCIDNPCSDDCDSCPDSGIFDDSSYTCSDNSDDCDSCPDNLGSCVDASWSDGCDFCSDNSFLIILAVNISQKIIDFFIKSFYNNSCQQKIIIT